MTTERCFGAHQRGASAAPASRAPCTGTSSQHSACLTKRNPAAGTSGRARAPYSLHTPPQAKHHAECVCESCTSQAQPRRDACQLCVRHVAAPTADRSERTLVGGREYWNPRVLGLQDRLQGHGAGLHQASRTIQEKQKETPIAGRKGSTRPPRRIRPAGSPQTPSLTLSVQSEFISLPLPSTCASSALTPPAFWAPDLAFLLHYAPQSP